jgi:hypothetical protein
MKIMSDYNKNKYQLKYEEFIVRNTLQRIPLQQ